MPIVGEDELRFDCRPRVFEYRREIVETASGLVFELVSCLIGRGLVWHDVVAEQDDVGVRKEFGNTLRIDSPSRTRNGTKMLGLSGIG